MTDPATMALDEVPATVTVRGLSKSFGGTRVLKGVDLSLKPGEIHGLLGQNGSGKSTLIKILAGYHAADEEGCVFAGDEVLPNPIDTKTLQRLGWSFVHQDLALLSELTVVDNFQMVGLRDHQGATIQWARERRWVSEQLESFDVRVSASAKISALTPMQRAMVAVVRAATLMKRQREEGDAAHGGLLILDEPTVYLPERELDELFGLVRRVASRGASVLFVSHRLPEIRELTQAVTVLRDGRVAISAMTADLTDRELVASIVGQDLEDRRRPDHSATTFGDTVLEVRGARGNQVQSADLTLRGGEIVGVCGLAGSGFDELPYLLFGAKRARAGTLTVDGKTTQLSSVTPVSAMAMGVALIPGDRLGEGAVGAISMRANVSLTSLRRFTTKGRISVSAERRAVRELAESYDIRPRRVEQRFSEFSGGNQQKGLMAKWLELEPRVLIAHEPVQGLDVEAAAQVLGQLERLAAGGAAVIVVSSDFQDIVSVCQRAVIFQHGRLTAEISGSELTEERLTNESHHAPSHREDLTA